MGLARDDVERLVHNSKRKQLLERILHNYRLLSLEGYQLRFDCSKREVSLNQVIENLDRVLEAFLKIPMKQNERRLFYSLLSLLSLDDVRLTIIIRDQYIKRVLKIANALIRVEKKIYETAQILEDYDLMNRLILALSTNYLPRYAGSVPFDELVERAGCVVSALNFLIYREKYLDILDKVYDSSTSVLWSNDGIRDEELKEILIKIVRASKQKKDKLKKYLSTNADPAVLILETFTNGCGVVSDLITSSLEEKETSRIYREFIQPYEYVLRRKVTLIEAILKEESSLQFLNIPGTELEELKTLFKLVNSELSTVSLYPWEFPYVLKKVDHARNKICENLRRSVKSRGNDVFNLCAGLKYVTDLCGNSLDITIVLKRLRS